MSDSSELFGQKLVNKHLITPDQLKEALNYQEALGGRLGAILVKLGMISEIELARAVAEISNVELLSRDQISVAYDLVNKFPRDWMQTRHFFPLQGSTQDIVLLAMADPLDLALIDRFAFEMNVTFQVKAVTLSDAEKILAQIFKPKPETQKKLFTASAKLDARDDSIRKVLNAASSREVLDALVATLVSKGIITYDELISNLDEEPNVS